MKSEYYKNILPWNENERVIDQFGWNIQSVITPTASSKSNWDDAYLPAWESKRQIYETAAENRLPKGVLMSEFHAGLCENIVHYWSMVGDTIVDPFAGRLTRAFVSQTLGRNYYGYDVSPETVKKVRHELDRHELGATIYEEDGCEMKSTPNESANLVMTCPPYADIERYESAEGQLSDIRKYDEFCERIQVCGDNIERVLKPGGFAVWVCGDFRKDGEYKSFHSDTINMFTKSGLKLHDIIVMKNNTIFAALQAGKCASKRYTAKVHEFVLVFRKEGELEYSSDKIKNREESLEQFFK
jgi:DNA modification methylase